MGVYEMMNPIQSILDFGQWEHFSQVGRMNLRLNLLHMCAHVSGPCRGLVLRSETPR